MAKFNRFLFVLFFFGASIQLQFLLQGYQRFQTWPPSVCFFRGVYPNHLQSNSWPMRISRTSNCLIFFFQGGGGKYPKISKHEFPLKPRAVKRNKTTTRCLPSTPWKRAPWKAIQICLCIAKLALGQWNPRSRVNRRSLKKYFSGSVSNALILKFGLCVL